MPQSENYRLFQEEYIEQDTDYYKPVRIIGVASGKKGTGKTSVTANLACALAEQGKSVMIFNADNSKQNINQLLNLPTSNDFVELWNGNCRIEDVIVRGPDGITVINNSEDLYNLIQIDEKVHENIVDGFLRVNDEHDVFLIDVPSGISDSTLHLLQAAHETIITMSDDPASIADSSVLIKLLNSRHSMTSFRVMVSQAQSHEAALQAFESLEQIVNHQYKLHLDYIGAIPFDTRLMQAHEVNETVVEHFPYSDAAFSFRGIAESINYWPLPFDDQINMLGFLERLVMKKC